MEKPDDLRPFIEAAQRAMANLSVPSGSIRLGQRPKGATYLAFEILNQDPEDRSKFFNPYVSRELYNWDGSPDAIASIKSAHDRLWQNPDLCVENNLPELAWEDYVTAKKDIQELLKKYEQKEIPTNVAATAVIHQGWKSGNLERIEPTSASAKGLFKESEAGKKSISLKEMLEQLPRELGLARWELGEPVIDGQRWIAELDDKEHQWIEISLIHKVDARYISDFKLIHYPLIIDSYWFIGLAYIFKVGNVPEQADIFDPKRYLQCLSLLVETVAPMVKRGLADRAINSIDFSGEITDNDLVQAARRYMSCFDFGFTDEAEARVLQLDGFESYPDFHLEAYVPPWVVIYQDALRGELNRLYSDIHRREIEVRAGEEQARADIGAGVFHNLAHYILPLSVYTESFKENVRNNRHQSALGNAVNIQASVNRMARFIAAVQPHIRSGGAYSTKVNEPLTDLPFEALSIQVEAIDAAIRWLKVTRNAGVPDKYRALLGALYGCDYTEAPGKALLQEKLKSAFPNPSQSSVHDQYESTESASLDVDQLTRWLQKLGLRVRFEGEFGRVYANQAAMIGIVEELLLNALTGAAQTLFTEAKEEILKTKPHLEISAHPESGDDTSSISIKNWSTVPLSDNLLKRPSGTRGWGLYAMNLILKDLGGIIELSNERLIPATNDSLYLVETRIVLPRRVVNQAS